MVAKIEKSDLMVKVMHMLSSGEIKETYYLKNNPIFFFIYKIAISK